VSGTNFNGTGLFKFELINADGSNVYWSNDGSVSGTVSVVTPPQQHVSLPVTNGLYSLLLGDTNVMGMTQPIPASAFTNGDARLRIWFDDGVHGPELLTPDQRIGSVGYALVAGSVSTVVVHAVYNNPNNPQSIPAGYGSVPTVAGWQTVVDTAGAFDGTTGTFTAPRAGKYFVEAYVSFVNTSSWAANTDVNIYPVVNGTGTEELSFASILTAYTGIFGINGTGMLLLNAGDKVQLGLTQTSAGPKTLRNGSCHFSIFLISN
jgi:hypothetical protein